jgi:hypothetical protein
MGRAATAHTVNADIYRFASAVAALDRIGKI